MWKALMQSLTGILGSKKAMMAIFGAIAAGLMKLGLHVDTETVGVVLTPLLTAIVSQGIADHGKGAAEVTEGKAP